MAALCLQVTKRQKSHHRSLKGRSHTTPQDLKESRLFSPEGLSALQLYIAQGIGLRGYPWPIGHAEKSGLNPHRLRG